MWSPGRGELAARAVGVSLTELKAPFPNSLIAEGDSAAGHHLFDIAEAQGKAKIQPNAMTYDLGGETMAMVESNRVRISEGCRMNTSHFISRC